MFELNATRTVYLHHSAIDFRKSISGLASLVEHGLGLNAFANAVFVFANRRRDRIKILGWDVNGFWLLHKRLEQGTFAWPTEPDIAPVEMGSADLLLLLAGTDLSHTRRRRWYERVA